MRGHLGNRKSVFDLLEEQSGLRVGRSPAYLEKLSLLAPRYYSISSSPASIPPRCSVTGRRGRRVPRVSGRGSTKASSRIIFASPAWRRRSRRRFADQAASCSKILSLAEHHGLSRNGSGAVSAAPAGAPRAQCPMARMPARRCCFFSAALIPSMIFSTRMTETFTKPSSSPTCTPRLARRKLRRPYVQNLVAP